MRATWHLNLIRLEYRYKECIEKFMALFNSYQTWFPVRYKARKQETVIPTTDSSFHISSAD
jgi:hypothetical protein